MAQTTSVRHMSHEVLLGLDRVVVGRLEKLGQPEPDSNLASERKSSAPHAPPERAGLLHDTFSSPDHGRSVPFSRSTW